MTKTCLLDSCDRVFSPNFKTQKYCSKNCGLEAARAARKHKQPDAPEGHKICGRCKVPKPLGNFSTVGKKRVRLHSYCNPCKNDYATERVRINRGLPEDAELRRGGTPKPLGSLRVHKGYIFEKVGEDRSVHPRADVTGWVFQHILVAEKKYGFPITTEFTVHHKNRNKSDNRPENLELRVGNHGRGGDLLPTLLSDPELQKEAAALLIEYGWNVAPPNEVH